MSLWLKEGYYPRLRNANITVLQYLGRKGVRERERERQEMRKRKVGRKKERKKEELRLFQTEPVHFKCIYLKSTVQYKNGMHRNIALWIHSIHCENSQYKTKWSWQAVKMILWFSHLLSKEKENAGSIPLLTSDMTYTVCPTCCHIFSYHCFSYPSQSNFN